MTYKAWFAGVITVLLKVTGTVAPVEGVVPVTSASEARSRAQ